MAKHCADQWPAGGVFLVKLTVVHLVHKFHTFHETQRLVTLSATVRYMSMCLVTLIHFTPFYPTSRPILILSSHLDTGLPVGLFPSGFPTKNLYVFDFFFFSIRSTCSAHLIFLNCTVQIKPRNGRDISPYSNLQQAGRFGVLTPVRASMYSSHP